MVFTSTISPKLMNWLTDKAKNKNTTKRAIIEKALESYKKETRKKELIEGFKKAAKDPETIELAEAGLGDYIEQLEKLES